MRVALEPLTLRFRAPVLTAFGALTERELLILTLETDDGLIGRGEAAPLEPYDGVALYAVAAQIEACRPLLEAGDPARRSELLADCRGHARLPQALAAIDLALWDLAGARAGTPVAELLGASARAVPVNATIAAEEPAEAATQAAAAAGAGFRCVKVKVGVGQDVARVAAVRAAVGPRIALRVDANGAWDVEEALAALRALAPHGVELAEEPVHGLASLRAVRERSPVPIAMDETAAAPGALASGATDFVCLKVARCGGIDGTLAAARSAQAAGAAVYVASTFDGPLGIAAGLHVAAALAPLPACGLATLGAFTGVGARLAPRDGAIALPSGPGLGVGPR